MLNETIMKTFRKAAKEHDLSAIAISRIESFLTTLASEGQKKAHEMDDDIKEILESLAEDNNGD